MFEHAQQLLKSKKPDEVARALNEQGFRNSSGDLWNKESVSWFLCFFFAARRCQLCDCLCLRASCSSSSLWNRFVIGSWQGGPLS